MVEYNLFKNGEPFFFFFFVWKEKNNNNRMYMG